MGELQLCSILGLFTAHCFFKRDVVFQLNILSMFIEISLLGRRIQAREPPVQHIRQLEVALHRNCIIYHNRTSDVQLEG